MRFGYADTAMGQVHYRRAGLGAPLLLLGSSGRSSSIFEGLMPLLAPHFDVVAIDTPGFGQSCPLPQGATIEALAACAAEVLDALGLRRCHLYGLHTGNKIATAFAGRWPERVDRLILAGQSHSLIPDRTLRNETILPIVRGYFEQPVPAPFTALADWAATFTRVSAAWWDPALAASGSMSPRPRRGCPPRSRSMACICITRVRCGSGPIRAPTASTRLTCCAGCAPRFRMARSA